MVREANVHEIGSLVHTKSEFAESKFTLRQQVATALKDYFSDLQGEAAVNVYGMVLSEVEAAIFETVLTHTRGNQTRAAQVLGISRGMLRAKVGTRLRASRA